MRACSACIETPCLESGTGERERLGSPIHQYAGNPAIFPPNVGLVDDADLNPATAAALDVAPQNLADRTAYLRRIIDSPSTINWGVQNNGNAGVTTAESMHSASYDARLGLWLVGIRKGVSPSWGGAVMWGRGSDPNDWNLLGNATTSFAGGWTAAVAADPGSPFYWSLATDGASVVEIDSLLAGTGSWGGTITVANGAGGELMFGFGHLITAITGSAGNASLGFVASGAYTPVITPSSAIFIWLLKQSPNEALAVPSITSAGTANYYRSTDGATWSTLTFSSSIVNTGEFPIGLTFCVGLNAWILAVGVATGIRFCQSTDGGATWSVISTLVASAGHALSPSSLNDLSSIGTTLLATTSDTTPVLWPSTTRDSRIIMSIDGGVSWYWAPGALTGNAAPSASYSRPRLAASPGQFLNWNTLALRLSQASGLSGEALA